jgi:N-glycosylase/DNA lyase
MVTSLCNHYSPQLLSLPPPCSIDGSEEAESYHPFPPPSVLAAPEVGPTLRSLGFGYRAEFIQRTAEMLVNTHGSKTGHDTREAAESWLTTLRTVSTSDAREELLRFIGVGRKVADCILLMSLDKVLSMVGHNPGRIFQMS